MKIPNGIYTLTNLQTGNHRTFRIRTIRKGKLADRRIVEMLVGSDNNNDYQAFGFVAGEYIDVWRRFQGNGKPSFHDKIAKLLMAMFSAQGPQGIDMQESRICMRCNRTLTTPESIATGYGPECIQHVGR